MSDAYLTPREVADRLGICKVDVVLTWIHAGQLKAVNVSAGDRRATWRIAAADLEKFLAGRTAVPAVLTDRRTRRKKLANVTRFF